MKAPLTERVIRSGESGQLLRKVDGDIVAEPLKRPAPRAVTGAGGRSIAQDGVITQVPMATSGAAPEAGSQAAGRAEKTRGGALSACGFHDLYIVMEQYPRDWVEWGVANDCMGIWNQSRDVFRYVEDDGTFGHNGVNEFCGYPTNADLMSMYGISWNPSYGGFAYSYYEGDIEECGRILEVDVFLNPAYTFTADPNVAVGDD